MLVEEGELSINCTILDLSLLFRLNTLRKMDGKRISAALSPNQSEI